MVLNTRDHKDSSSILRFFVSHHKKRGAHFKLDANKQKNIFFLFWPHKGVVGGGVGQKHVIIVLGRSHNSFDASNWANNQKKNFLHFLKFWPFEGDGGGTRVQMNEKHVTIVIGRSHSSSPACNWAKKMFYFFLFWPNLGPKPLSQDNVVG